MKQYRISVKFNDGGSVSFNVCCDSFPKAVKSALSSYHEDIQRRISSINIEDVTL